MYLLSPTAKQLLLQLLGDIRRRRLAPKSAARTRGTDRDPTRKSLLRRIAVACLLLAANFALAQVRSKSPATKQIDAIFSPLVTPGSPGLAVIVLKNGTVAFEKAYGLANVGIGAANTPDTDFRLASFTKQFTATCIMLLVHDGKLSYDDTLTKIFPGFPTYGSAITVRMLLTHTSGLKDYEDLYAAQFPRVDDGKIPQIHDAQILALMERQTATDFPPGSQWRYSNTGYAMLAMIVEKVSGKSFGDFLHERIFEPLGMKNTLAYEKAKNEVPHRALGYAKKNGTWVEADQSSTSAVLGDGGIYSNVEDLGKWDRALRGHTLLSAAEMQAAFTPVKVPGGAKTDDGGPTEYGFGWFLDPYKGQKRAWHSGTTIGFRTYIERFTDEGLTIIILCNRDDLKPGKLAERVADLFAAR
jgi:CubicO group peptidase (beta-lactamase class C family)